MLKENGYQGSIIRKIFKRITNNHSLCQSQEQTQATDIPVEEIRININLPYVKNLRFHKIRSFFYTESALRKLPCKPKDRVATEDKNNRVNKIDCSNCEAVYFCESKRFLKPSLDELKRPVSL